MTKRGMPKVPAFPKYGHCIDGADVPPASNEYLATDGPYTGKLKAGTIWANNYRATSYHVAVWSSGIGRESGAETIKEFLDTKCVHLHRSRRANPFHPPILHL